MHLGMHALGASDHATCGLTMMFTFLSDDFRLIPRNFGDFWGMLSSRWPCHGLSRSVTAFSDNAQDLSIFFVFCYNSSRFVTVCHAQTKTLQSREANTADNQLNRVFNTTRHEPQRKSAQRNFSLGFTRGILSQSIWHVNLWPCEERMLYLINEDEGPYMDLYGRIHPISSSISEHLLSN